MIIYTRIVWLVHSQGHEYTSTVLAHIVDHISTLYDVILQLQVPILGRRELPQGLLQLQGVNSLPALLCIFTHALVVYTLYWLRFPFELDAQCPSA